jgi:hypothetical protein
MTLDRGQATTLVDSKRDSNTLSLLHLLAERQALRRSPSKDTTMAYRIMFDSVNPGLIPTTAEIVAGYIDGKYVWSAADWARFPNAQKLQINVTGDASHGGLALDVETGDATPADAPAWYDARVAAGVKGGLIIYCNRSTLPAVESAMGSRSYYRWVATLDGTINIPGYTPLAGPAAVQFLGQEQIGVNVDMSLVMNDGFMPEPSLAQIKANIQAAQSEATNALALIAKYESQV